MGVTISSVLTVGTVERQRLWIAKGESVPIAERESSSLSRSHILPITTRSRSKSRILHLDAHLQLISNSYETSSTQIVRDFQSCIAI